MGQGGRGREGRLVDLVPGSASFAVFNTMHMFEVYKSDLGCLRVDLIYIQIDLGRLIVRSALL